MNKTCLTIAAMTAAFTFAASQAQALIPRAWVSGHGTDAAGCGPVATPCRSLQYVHDNIIAPGGEIDILDPAGYGAITITKAISIVNDGVGTAGVQTGAGQDAITISAGATDVIALRGLNIDGLGVSDDGVNVSTAGSVEIVNCVVRHFTVAGVIYEPSSHPISLSISNSLVANNAIYGVFIQEFNGTNNEPVVLNFVTAHDNGVGVFEGFSHVMVANSNIFSNTTGIQTESSGQMYLAKNIIFGNATGVSVGGGNVFSYGDNDLKSNTTDVSGALIPVATQ